MSLSTPPPLVARPHPLTCLVTDRRGLATLSGSIVACLEGGLHRAEIDLVVSRVAIAASCGVDLVQIREPDLEGRALLELAYACVETVRGTDTLVVVNERVDVAMAAGAHGAHLRGSSMPAAALRSMVPAAFLLGRSVHGAGDVLGGGDRNLDYLIAGTVFRSRSKPSTSKLLGPEGLAEIVSAAAVPVLAIGGVSLRTAPEIAATGAAGVAAIDLWQEATASEERCREVVRTLRRAFARPAPGPDSA